MFGKRVLPSRIEQLIQLSVRYATGGDLFAKAAQNFVECSRAGQVLGYEGTNVLFAVEPRAPSLLLKSRDQVVRDRDFDGQAYNHAPALILVEPTVPGSGPKSARSVVIEAWPGTPICPATGID